MKQRAARFGTDGRLIDFSKGRGAIRRAAYEMLELSMML
jgi:hypothetical protein